MGASKERKFYVLSMNTNVCRRNSDDAVFKDVIVNSKRKRELNELYRQNRISSVNPSDYCNDADVIGELIDGQMYDVITGEKLYYNKSKATKKFLSFYSYVPISIDKVVKELRKYDDESKNRYRDCLNKVKEKCVFNYNEEQRNRQLKRKAMQAMIDSAPKDGGRKFFNVSLNNNVCREEGWYAPNKNNVFTKVIYYPELRERHEKRNIETYGKWRGSRMEIDDSLCCGNAMIIAELIDDEVYDVITGERLYLNRNGEGSKNLSFYEYAPITRETVVRELQKYDSDSFTRYKECMEKVKRATYIAFQEYLEEYDKDKKRDLENQRIKNIANNGFDSFMDSIRKRTRK